MTIEELKELKKIVDDAVISSYADFTLEEGYNLVCLIEAEQQRRSVKSEDVQEAIEQCEYALEDEQLESDGEWSSATFSTTAINTMITALQAYRPVEVADEDVKRAIKELSENETTPNGYDCYGKVYQQEEQSTQSESQPCDVYELAVYKKLGITSERANQLTEMEKSNNDI